LFLFNGALGLIRFSTWIFPTSTKFVCLQKAFV
jgi:hypothetical protein